MSKSPNKLMLCLETATRQSGLALLDGDAVLASRSGTEDFSHSGELLAGIEKLLVENDVRVNQIEALAIAVGPGGFTGLRVGLATAKGLATALRIPIYGVPTLAAISSAAVAESVCAIVPAGRDNVFGQTFRCDSGGRLRESTKLKTGVFADVLDELIINSVSAIVAPTELFEALQHFAKSRGLNQVSLSETPFDLAVWVGRAALQNAAADVENGELQIIYGREADVSKSKQ